MYQTVIVIFGVEKSPRMRNNIEQNLFMQNIYYLTFVIICNQLRVIRNTRAEPSHINVRRHTKSDSHPSTRSSNNTTYMSVGFDIFHYSSSISMMTHMKVTASVVANLIDIDVDELPTELVTPEHFHKLVNIVYPSFEKVNEENIEVLLALSNYYEVEHVIAECELFLIDDTENSSPQKVHMLTKLVWADTYGLNLLRDACLLNMNNADEVKEMMLNGEFRKLGKDTIYEISKKYAELTA